jgi:4-hydroxy-tetrahydrodipicolinate synthase
VKGRRAGSRTDSGETFMPTTVSDLVGRLLPAVPVPFTRTGEIHETALEQYARWMATQPIGGVAVWAHTGRGLRITDSQRERVLRAWRRHLPRGCALIAAAGPLAGEAGPARMLASAKTMAQRALDLGADAILVHPPSAVRDLPDRDRLILDYHAHVADAGLPTIVFYLYEAAGGIAYSPQVLAELVSRPGVLGIKIATLDSVMTFQDIAHLVKTKAPDKLILTGEDRFLGYSLMAGAQSALVGMAAACTALQADLVESYRQGRAGRFLALSAAVDDLARHTFVAPMEGYIQRMLWCLVHDGVIPADGAFDPWAPQLDPVEYDRIGVCLERVRDGAGPPL